MKSPLRQIRPSSFSVHWGIIVLIGAVAIIGLARAHAAEWEQPYPILGACTSRDSTAFGSVPDPLYIQCMTSVGDAAYCSSLYPPQPLPFDAWGPTYHKNVNEIVEYFFGKPTDDNLALRQSSAIAASCGNGGGGDVHVSPKLSTIAKGLEPWAGSSTAFQSSDIAPVLLEYLRVYECSLAERSTELPLAIWREESARRGGLPGGITANPIEYQNLLTMWYEQKNTINHELSISRPTLERVLALMGTVNMTRMVVQDTECLQRASLDIRNVIALSADAAACLPRIWNAKDPLRNPSACSDGLDNDHDQSIDLSDSGCSGLSDNSE